MNSRRTAKSGVIVEMKRKVSDVKCTPFPFHRCHETVTFEVLTNRYQPEYCHVVIS